MASTAQDITRLLARLNDGERSAEAELIPIVYDELRALAATYFRRERPDHTLQPTALVHEAYVRLLGAGDTPLRSRAHFFALAARLMRQTLVNHAEAHRAAKRGGSTPTLSLEADSGEIPAPVREIDTLALDEALKGLAALDARKARVVEMRFFAGMTLAEAAQALGVSVSTVEADWRTAKAWLTARLKEA